MRNYLINCFHITIIAFVVFSFIGCGYKTPPVYVPKDKVVKDAK
jgi:predicted small lipoprotein YifL